MKNQAVYYNAIEADITAVNDRLRSLKSPTKEEEIIYADEVCDAPLALKETPFQHHRKCVAAIQADLERLSTEQEQAVQKKKLTERLRTSIKELISAQVTDEDLVKEENSISAQEADRAAKDKYEVPGWTAIWAEYAKRAKSKTGSLSAAVVTSKKTERMLNAKQGVYVDTLARLKEQLNDTEATLAQTSTMGKSFMSLVQTGLQIVKVGWPALLYIIVAWLLLGFIRKYRDRKEENAVAAQEGEGNKELAQLHAELEAAQAQDDNETTVSLHEEIVKLIHRSNLNFLTLTKMIQCVGFLKQHTNSRHLKT